MEVGAKLDTLTMNRFPSTSTAAGLGGRFTWNLFPSLALETHYDFYPADYTPVSTQDGGKTQTWFTGVKVTPLRRNRWSVGGTTSIGLVSFGNVAVQTSALNVDFRRVTHFATEMGGVFEYYPTSRWIVRSDIGMALFNIGTRKVDIGSGGQVVAPGSLRPAFQFSLGVGYRLGKLEDVETESASDSDEKWEVAGQFVLQSRGRSTLLGSDTATEPGIGGRVTYDLLPFVSVEAALTFFVRSESDSTPFDGGRSTQLLVGVKSGIRHDKFGYFVRVRPGFQTFSQAIQSVTLNPTIVHFGGSTHPALDLGGGLEVFPTSRTVLRFDVGDTLLFLGSASYPIGSQTASQNAGTVNSFQFSTSFGWRF